VTPKVITQYIAWWNAAGRGVAKVSYIKTFFNWAIPMGYREQANPVINSFHNPRRKKGEPRPYSPKEMENIWTLLDERGDARVRFAVAIAEEAGLRRAEICRLRVQDIDVTTQRCFVRLPNKPNRERYALFGEKTKRRFEAWMKERDPACGHDALLYNEHGKKQVSAQALTRYMNLTLCRTYLGQQVNKTGLDRFSLHRLRHTMATNLVRGGADMKTVMANGGWKSYDAACGYAAPDLQVARRGYHDAMRRVQAKKQTARQTRILSPAELLTRKSKRLVRVDLEEPGIAKETREGA
jgi:integrase